MKLINIEICSNNRDDYLFRFFIPSLENIKHLNNLCCITINYNGDISMEKIEEANKLIQEKGFELYWAYNTYEFEPEKNKILKIRYDCDKIGPETKYVLLGDDDLEFLAGYDRPLLAATQLMEQDSRVGLVSLRKQPLHMRATDTLMPADPGYFFVLCGGLLMRRVPGWNGIYPEELLELHGGGEERVLGCEMMREGYRCYYLHTDRYLHEQHWGVKGVYSGQCVYKWSWDTNDDTTIMSRINSYRDTTKHYSNYELAWTDPDRYWLIYDNRISYANKSTAELYNNIMDSIGLDKEE